MQDATTFEELDKLWTIGGWSIGRSSTGRTLTAYVHGYGTCASGHGATPREAFDEAVAKFRKAYPDPITAKRQLIERTRAELEALEREAA